MSDDAEWKNPGPGQIMRHVSDPVNGGVIGYHFGLTETTSAWVGELSAQTLSDAGVDEALHDEPKWWLAVIENGSLFVLGTVDDELSAEALATWMVNGIRAARGEAPV